MLKSKWSARQKPREFQSEESGAITVLSLFLTLTAILVTGIAIDMSQLIAARTQLQVAADVAGHAALYKRDTMSEFDAKSAALELVADVMPQQQFGTVLTAEDIQFGTWDPVNERFSLDHTSKSAVRIVTSRFAERENPVSAFLLQFVGFSQFDVRAQAVFTTFRPTCFREGFVAEGVVDIQSNNGFTNGFCIHSNTYVSLNQNNTFEAGTIVSMPDSGDLELPQSGFEKNDGLEAALRDGYYRMRLVNRIPGLIDDVSTYGTANTPSYINSATAVTITPKGKKVDPSQFVPGRIHFVNCNGGGSITVGSGLYQEVVLSTNCELKFANGVSLEDAIFATTNTAVKSMTSPNGLRVGRDDNCADGGGAQLITMGGMDFASSLQVYGSQLLARKDIAFAANANGIEGASFVSGGMIDGTSNMQMGFCGTGMNNFEAEYYRLAY